MWKLLSFQTEMILAHFLWGKICCIEGYYMQKIKSMRTSSLWTCWNQVICISVCIYTLCDLRYSADSRFQKICLLSDATNLWCCWAPHRDHIAITWASHGYCMHATWVSHACHMELHAGTSLSKIQHTSFSFFSFIAICLLSDGTSLLLLGST